MKLNEQQQAAVTRLDKDLLVMAGAGTGKTRVLTQKYLYLLQTKKCEVPQIVAVTFTRKAAAEMKARIRQQLKKEYTQSTGSERAYWSRQLEFLEVAAQITTIHGLCFSLLMQHPVEAGIDPRAVVLDEGEEYLLKTKAARNALSKLLSAAEDPSLMAMVLSLGTDFFLNRLTGLYSTLRDTGVELETLELLAVKTGAPDLEGIKAGLRLAVEALLYQAGEVKLTPRAQQLLADFSACWTELKAGIEQAASLTEETNAALVQLLSYLPGNLNKQLRPAIEQVCNQVEFLQTALATVEAVRQRPILLRYLRLFEEEYTAIKQAEGKIDFTDQQFLVRRLLRAYPEITAEYRRSFKYFMVDEFQDTNRLQWEIIRLLTGEEYQGGRLFLVGDLKQSIYRFRGAEVEIMTDLARAYQDRPEGAVLVLDQNYRTKPQVAGVINGLCQELFATEAFPYHPLLPLAGQDEHREAGVEILIAAENEPELLAVRLKKMVESAELSIRTGSGQRPVQYRDLALLFRVRTGLKKFEDALTAAGVPYVVHAGIGFYARQEIQDQINLLRVVESPDDSLALAGVLRSPFCQLSDEALFWLAIPDGLAAGFFGTAGGNRERPEISPPERARIFRFYNLLQALRENAHLLSIPDLLRLAWRETGYLETAAALPGGTRIMANLEKLLVRAEEFVAKGYTGVGDFVGFLRHLSNLEVREGEAVTSLQEGDMVKLMTIHAAKGLEFPVVVVPELARAFNRKRSTLVAYHPDFGLVHKVRTKEGNWFPTVQTAQVQEREERAELSELKRLFYVALTRAKDYLLLSGTATEIKADRVDEADSWMEWLYQIIPELCEPETEALCFGGEKIKVTREVTGIVAGEASSRPDPEEKTRAQIASALEMERPLTKAVTRKLSLTPLLTFQECPRRFYWEYRLGAEPQFVTVDHRPEEEAGYGVLLGEVFHHLITGKTLGKEVPPAKWGEWLERFPEPERERARVELEIMRSNYLRSPFYPRDGERVENEYPFLLKLDDVVITGVIDRILFTPDGDFTVVDFKTNRRVPPPGKIRDRYLFQVTLYALALREIFGRLPEAAWVYFVRADEKIPSVLTPANLAQTERKIRETVAYIGAHDRLADYPAGEDCRFCPFCSWCPDASVSS